MSAQANQLLSLLNEEELFTDASLTFDLREGVIWNPAKTRLCVLSTDLLGGIYRGLVEEAGPGWRFIFRRCGSIWGARLAKRLDQECSSLLGRRIGDISLEDFLRFIRDYFVFHGWGVLTMNVDHARESGIIEATLVDSIFAEIVDDAEEMADPMIAGILASLVGYLAGRELDCVQTECSTRGAVASRFIISAPERLRDAEAAVKSGRKHEELIQTL